MITRKNERTERQDALAQVTDRLVRLYETMEHDHEPNTRAELASIIARLRAFHNRLPETRNNTSCIPASGGAQ